MRSFGSLALKQVRSRRARSLLTAAGIVLGVGMILGVLLLSATINRTFTDLYDSVYGKADLIVSGGGEDSLPKNALRKVESAPGAGEVVGRIQSVFTLVDDEGAAPPDASKQLNVAGQDPNAAEVTDSETVAGTEPERGREIAIQDSWADANDVKVDDRISLATPDGERRFDVVGLFRFQSGFEFGGEGFAVMPLDSARKVMDKTRSFDEIDVIAAGGEETIATLERRIDRRFGKGVDVETPQTKSEDVESQLQAFNAILYFFAAMALFVGGFLIFNAFNMTVLQRTREIGMLRTLGTPRRRITGSVLREAALLGLVGAVLGLGLGFALAWALAEFVRALDFPVGRLVFTWWAPVAAVTTGLLTAVLGAFLPARRAGRTSPIRAVLGSDELRPKPSVRRGVLGCVLIMLGLGGAFWLGAAEETTPIVAAAGMTGTVAIFFGIAMVAPFVVRPLVRVLSWPVRRILPVEGRLASDAARSDPGRTAATATALLIGLALVVAVNSLGASFLGTISDEFDRAFARDLTVQPSGLSPGQGPQQTIGDRLSVRLEKIPEAAVVARERFLFTSDLPGPKGKTKSDGLIVGFEPTEYSEVDTTDIIGASRDEVFRLMREDGDVTVGKGFADEEDIEVGDTLKLEGPSDDRKARVAGIVETVLFGGQTVGMSLTTL
ncbi:MAG TPA: ABC transporter permease, partial [Solirubrobacterales bacterium]|nr:ABC transporter permease [Solirubrobacterales bacterium]